MFNFVRISTIIGFLFYAYVCLVPAPKGINAHLAKPVSAKSQVVVSR